MTGIAVFATLRLLTWWTWGAVRSPIRDLAYLSAWVALACALFVSAHAALKVRRRQQWVQRQQSVAALRQLSWAAFERLVAEVFAAEGYQVTLAGQSGADGGVDVVIRRRGETVLVQCKHWQANKVGAPIVREMLGLAMHYAATGVVIVCTGGFTKEAYRFAQGKPIRLIDGQQLVRLIRDEQAT